MFCLLECIALESLCNLRVSFAVCLTAHCKIHPDLGAFSCKVVVKALHNLGVSYFAVTDLVLAGPVQGAFLDLDEFVSLCMAYRTLCRWILSFVYITAY